MSRNVESDRQFGPGYVPPLKLSPMVQKDPFDFAIYTWPDHKDEIVSMVPDAAKCSPSSWNCQAWQKYVADDTQRAAGISRTWGYAMGTAPGLTPGYYADYWNGFDLATAISFQNTTAQHSLREIPPFLLRKYYDQATVNGTIARLLSHAAINWALDIPSELYGNVQPQTNTMAYDEFTYALVPNGHVQFGSNVSQPLEKAFAEDIWHPEPIQEYVLGGAKYYLFIPEQLTSTRLQYLQVSQILTLSGKNGPYIVANYAPSEGSQIPYPPLFAPGQLSAAYKAFGALFKALKKLPGAPYAMFRKIPAYNELKQFWPLEFPSPILSVLEVGLLQDDPLAYFQNITNKDKATIYARRLHDFYKLYFSMVPDAEILAPASGYNRYRYPFMKNYVDVSDLPHVDLPNPPFAEDFNNYGTPPERYGQVEGPYKPPGA